MFKLRKKTTDKLVESAGTKFSLNFLKDLNFASKVALFILLFIIINTIFADFLAPNDPLEIFLPRRAPSFDFLFGTDDKGRDIFSRMLFGGRYSLVIGLGATTFALIVGSIIGSIAAVARK